MSLKALEINYISIADNPEARCETSILRKQLLATLTLLHTLTLRRNSCNNNNAKGEERIVSSFYKWIRARTYLLWDHVQ